MAGKPWSPETLAVHQALPAGKGGTWKKGVSANPNGKISLKNDLARANAIGVPPEVTAAIDDWFAESESRLAELGAAGFIAGLRAALDEAAARVLPLTPAEARAMWWRTVLPISFAGPQGPKDSNWTYANQEVGVRLLGKPKEHVVIEGTDAPGIDWSLVPAEEREEILTAMAKLQAYVGEPDSATEH